MVAGIFIHPTPTSKNKPGEVSIEIHREPGRKLLQGEERPWSRNCGRAEDLKGKKKKKGPEIQQNTPAVGHQIVRLKSTINRVQEPTDNMTPERVLMLVQETQDNAGLACFKFHKPIA